MAFITRTLIFDIWRERLPDQIVNPQDMHKIISQDIVQGKGEAFAAIAKGNHQDPNALYFIHAAKNTKVKAARINLESQSSIDLKKFFSKWLKDFIDRGIIHFFDSSKPNTDGFKTKANGVEIRGLKLLRHDSLNHAEVLITAKANPNSIIEIR